MDGHMPKQAAAGGGTYLGTAGWLKLADENAVVLIFKHRRMEDYVGTVKDNDGNTKTAVQIAADVLVLAPEKRAGEFWPGQNIINGAITSKLVDEPDGTAIGSHIAQGKTGANKWPMADPTSEPEWKLVEAAYAERGVDITSPTADADLFAQLRKAHAAEQRDGVREKVGAVSGAKGASAADDDEPPF